MSEQDRISFENWYISEHCKDLSDISINEVMAKTSLGVYSSFHVNGAYSGWQSATAEANKRIDALEGEVERKDSLLRALENVADELKASNNDLREAIETALYGHGNDALPKLRKAISATPSESLVKHDDELIEKVIAVIESLNVDAMFKPVSFSDMFVAIRALKGK